MLLKTDAWINVFKSNTEIKIKLFTEKTVRIMSGYSRGILMVLDTDL